jgi:CspA family cold shock protein
MEPPIQEQRREIIPAPHREIPDPGGIRLTGRVQRYFKPRRYGWLRRDDGFRDLFVHILNVEPPIDLLEGQRVTFEVAADPREPNRIRAVNVRRLGKDSS